MFNEMYLQKCEECSGGEIIGANEDSLKTLKNCCFRVREIVSDNPSASVLAYKLLLKESGHLDDNDAEYLIKNVTNNLLNYKRFIFPAFEYDGFEDPVSFKGAQTSWKLYHDVFEKYNLLEVNLRKAPK